MQLSPVSFVQFHLVQTDARREEEFEEEFETENDFEVNPYALEAFCIAVLSTTKKGEPIWLCVCQ